MTRILAITVLILSIGFIILHVFGFTSDAAMMKCEQTHSRATCWEFFNP